jgi:ADP-ribosylglycohydrolase
MAAAAIGDAMGAATVGYTPSLIKERYGGPLRGFVQPIPAHKLRSQWGYAEITDDTMLIKLTAQSIALHGAVVRRDIAQRIIGLSDKYARGSSGKFKERNDANAVIPPVLGNGAATRCIAVGIMYSLTDLERMLNAVLDVSIMTHGTRTSVEAAAVIACMISGAIEELSFQDTLAAALEAARSIRKFHLPEDGGNLEQEIRRCLAMGYIAFSSSSNRDGEWGFIVTESIALIISILAEITDTREAILAAVNVGGDADSTAAMVGAISAARNPESFPTDWWDTVSKQNNLDFGEVSLRLSEIRTAESCICGGSR